MISGHYKGRTEKAAPDGGFRVLVVEDDSGLNRLVSRILKREGFSVKTSLSGQEAIASLQEDREVLVLMDFYLSDMTGTQLIERLEEQGITVPFIVMTGHGDERTAVEMMKLGARDYIVKEADFVTLLPHILRRTRDQLEKERRLIRTERMLKQREQALQSVYHIATERDGSFQLLCDQAAASLATILHVPCVVVQVETLAGKVMSRHTGCGPAGHDGVEMHNDPCEMVLREKRPIQMQEDLRARFAGCSLCGKGSFKSFVGVPIGPQPRATAMGSICAFDKKKRVFTEEEIHLIEIFAQYFSHEVEHERMEQQLHQAREMQLLGQLTSGLAHEVRNPLNAIGAIVEALFEEIGEDPTYDEFQKHLRTQVDRMSNLMQDLLLLGRPMSHLEKRRVSLRTLCDHVVETWNEANAKLQVTARVDGGAADDHCEVYADPGRLQQAVTNLLDNAAHHSPKGSIITLQHRPFDGRYYRIRVIDRGSGIRPDLIDRIFEPFFTTRRSGTGLGLSIVRRMVEMHNGRVRVANNDPGPGVTVELSLPPAELTRDTERLRQDAAERP